ncbi:hypothetical protein GCM10011517_09100 [Actibacterium pelagium]|uniref:Uncharacterized protein n=1 Tax=Actibacterium pelagium TaxID=2029103 RepID=A0A917ADJ0_9RHOB|nr:hypothetical protein GCM10011517_09100 [Actibacterium pelagium]
MEERSDVGRNVPFMSCSQIDAKIIPQIDARPEDRAAANPVKYKWRRAKP